MGPGYSVAEKEPTCLLITSVLAESTQMSIISSYNPGRGHVATKSLQVRALSLISVVLMRAPGVSLFLSYQCSPL